MLCVINRHPNVDGSRRLSPIGSGVHHLDGDFFAGEQVANVPDQSLSVYRDNIEGYWLGLAGIGPGGGDEPVRATGDHPLQSGAITPVDRDPSANGGVPR